LTKIGIAWVAAAGLYTVGALPLLVFACVKLASG
jgi:hypothetical protein